MSRNAKQMQKQLQLSNISHKFERFKSHKSYKKLKDNKKYEEDEKKAMEITQLDEEIKKNELSSNIKNIINKLETVHDYNIDTNKLINVLDEEEV